MKYLKSDEEIRKDIHEMAQELTVDDLIPYLQDAENWQKNQQDEFDNIADNVEEQATKIKK
ncbi:YtxH domain-containing protein [Lentilactobacillus otakiensis]|uniref:Uncharacterized protein n=1 Tax=Lentilactobacillus otakiensis DSM 19908 = JCM 15040 TaxID=1423780 RepID=S4NQV4_9LACO|nr:YtxH domain-containing protein [Lentilactobacillus otakiensis]KRL10171.1 hypothetical protein FD05_GL000290 [Lentilactobacillus otakiensis DSM 19908 = JCM 15040]MBZ3777276.1 YtxH domain-containing protein [Lentilactobacillus otakiensis]GAD16413.1 hypothetical protein LOT_0951 [Lentilactobacillus otakiensis DSM 19908 = JCM 15040]